MPRRKIKQRDDQYPHVDKIVTDYTKKQLRKLLQHNKKRAKYEKESN